MIIPAVSGGAVYLVSSLTREPQEWALMLSAFVGGVTLVIQFLIEFDRSLREVEKGLAIHTMSMDKTVREGFLKTSAATATYSMIEASPVGAAIGRLVQEAAALTDSTPEPALLLARSEVCRVTRLLHELGEGQAAYDGEDQDWLLALTRAAVATMDATSTLAADGGTADFDGGFWTTPLGHRYLGAQRDADSRGVVIRRLFLNPLPLAGSRGFQVLCRRHIEAHIAVRVLDPSDIPVRRASSFFDFVLFDGMVSYETIPAMRLDFTVKPSVFVTHLNARRDHVQGRCALFAELWEMGHELD